MISKSGGSAAQQMAFNYINGMQTPAMQLKLAKLFGYLPAKISVAKKYVKLVGPGVERLREPDALRPPADARSRCQVSEDLAGGVDGHPGRVVGLRSRFRTR